MSIWPVPVEVPDPIRFEEDTVHRSYDPDAAATFWRVLLAITPVLEAFRARFIGKCSPVHFFWGSFDMAVTRFSGRLAPPFSGTVPGVSLEVMREAYSHECSSAGFWPGGPTLDHAAFYSYAYPVPKDLASQSVRPRGAYFSEQLGEFLLPYDEVRRANDPEAALMEFLESTYEAAATTARWDRDALECEQGRPAAPRTTFRRS